MDSFRSSKVQTLEGFPIRNSTDQGILAPPRGLSQLYTSFIGCQYQGIHRKLFVALPVQKINLFRIIDWLYIYIGSYAFWLI